MNRLLSIELQKIWKNRASKVLTITYFVLLSSVALMASINFKFIGIDFRLADMGIFNFPYIWHFNTFIASILKFFLAIVIVSMVANEYSYGTLKQNLIDGLSKKEFIVSKYMTVFLFALLSTTFIFIMTLILGYSFSPYNEIAIVFTDINYLLAYFVKLMGFFSFCLFVGILIKRSAFAIGFVMVWYFTEKIIQGLLNWLVFESSVQVNKVIAFFPLESMSNLIDEPITRLKAIRTIENQIAGTNEIRDYSVHFSSIIIVLTWTALFMFLSYKILKKRDL
jgi:ABC-2 type transport system permease protein